MLSFLKRMTLKLFGRLGSILGYVVQMSFISIRDMRG